VVSLSKLVFLSLAALLAGIVDPLSPGSTLAWVHLWEFD